MRATICVDVNHEDERASVEAWFARWRERLLFVSENEGCGCCVDMWSVDGPAEAMSELPSNVRASSQWAGSQ